MKHFFNSAILASLIIIQGCANVPEPSAFGPVPNENQLSVMDMETYAFLHYSLNTYTGEEWGYGNEDPAMFNPSSLDARQWARTCKEEGLRFAVVDSKACPLISGIGVYHAPAL